VSDRSLYPDLEVIFFQGGATSLERDGDTVNLAVADDYASLSSKVAKFFEYCLQEYEFEHLFKCDDDTYVHLPRLLNMDLAGIDYAGFNEDNRGAASGGGGYWVSRRAAALVVDNAQFWGARPDEDIMVGTILREAGIAILHIDGLPHRLSRAFDPGTAPLPWNRQITGHYSTPEQMYAIRAQWDAISDGSSDKFTIRRAVWGVGGDWVDVTDRIMNGNCSTAIALLNVTPAQFGDPAFGRRKSLIIDLEHNGASQQLVIGEDFTFVLVVSASMDGGSEK
jgi:hypothetical protein